MKKLVCESLEEYKITNDVEGDKKFLEEELNQIKGISSVSEVDKWVFEKTCGHQFPLNPKEPLRSAIREKLQELHSLTINEDEKARLFNLLSMVEGEFKPINMPDDAMY